MKTIMWDVVMMENGPFRSSNISKRRIKDHRATGQVFLKAQDIEMMLRER